MEHSEFVFSADALYNRDYFLGQYSEINLYFEDNKKEYFYELLMKRLLNCENIGIFCLEGKPSLYKKYDEINGESKNKSIFIADGDFDKLIGITMINSDSFIYLEKYNIESYLFDKDAIIKFISGNFKISNKEASEIINFDSWLEKTIFNLSEFFILCAVQKKLLPDEKIFYFDIFDNDGSILINKCQEKKEKILEVISEDELMQEVSKLKEKVKLDYNDDYSFIICGKHLFHSLKNFIRYTSKKMKLGHPFYDDDFQYFIVNCMNMLSLDYVKNKIDKFLIASNN